MVKILYFSGCQNWQKAAERTRRALIEMGCTDVSLVVEDVQGITHLPRDWAGSPTVLVDGRDPFADGDSHPALPQRGTGKLNDLAVSREACRMYRTAAGLEGAPSLDELRRAVRVAAQLTERKEKELMVDESA